ncbi:MAG: glycosyltransferase family 2 protein [Actinomycetota bacterium]
METIAVTEKQALAGIELDRARRTGVSAPAASGPAGLPEFEHYAAGFSRRLERSSRRIRTRLIFAAQVATVIGLVLGIRYLGWRVGTLEGTGVAGAIIGVAEVVGFAFFALSSYLFWDIEQRSRAGAPPAGTLDVFVPVCGEPLHIIEETLRSALQVRYPHNTYLLNDGRIAGSDNWQAVEEMACAYGVQCFTRTMGCRRKAGNLNFALRRTGGEFVAVIDADHAVQALFADELLGYFADPQVGFVTTPQHFKTSKQDIFGNLETYFYGHIQRAKDAANSAFSTGNGVVYRRSAIESIGGFSEWNIVEDLHSSYEMHARGWRSVYHPKALTSGLCPHTGAEVVRQRLGWATDTLRLLLWDNPLRKSGLTLRQRLNYLQVGAFYLVMVMQLALLVAPALVLLWGVPILTAESAGAYLGHALPFFFLQFAVVALPAGLRGGLRATQKCIYLTPTYLVALVGAATAIKFRSPVTDKGEGRRRMGILAPQWLLFVLLVVAMTRAFTEPNLAHAIAAVWAGWIASALAIPLFTWGSRPGLHRLARPLVRISLAVASLAALVLALV